MEKRSPFPRVFWVANGIEILERLAYYGIYLGFGIYMEYLGFSKSQLGVVQALFLFFSYFIPVIAGTFADRYGFKKVFIISYLAYLPSILLLIVTRSFSGIALTMLSIGLAAGIFKPLVSGTVRVVTDKSNKTLGFGIFYAMVNVGASFGPIIAGKLRAISWNYAFLAGAIAVFLMLIITIFFYKEPEREVEGVTLKRKFRDLAVALSDIKFTVFLIVLGLFFWLPLWSFFNILAMYVDRSLDTARLYLNIKSVLGANVANFFSRVDDDGIHRILGETISHSGYIVMICQIFVSRMAERFKAIPVFSAGMAIAACGFFLIGTANLAGPAWVFLGIFLFAVGEMACAPRIQEYITWLAPKEKAGLYMGANFLPMGVGGALAGLIYTPLYGYFRNLGHSEYVWFLMALNMIVGIVVIFIFMKTAGEFKELDS